MAGPNADMNVTRPSRVIDPDRGTIDTPEDLADWLLTHSRFVATEEESASVAGAEARVIDIEAQPAQSTSSPIRRATCACQRASRLVSS